VRTTQTHGWEMKRLVMTVNMSYVTVGIGPTFMTLCA